MEATKPRAGATLPPEIPRITKCCATGSINPAGSVGLKWSTETVQCLGARSRASLPNVLPGPGAYRQIELQIQGRVIDAPCITVSMNNADFTTQDMLQQSALRNALKKYV